MDPVVVKWMESRLEAESDDYSDGYFEGYEWASVYKPGCEFTGLKEFRTSCSSDEWAAFFRDADDPDSLRRKLFVRTHPSDDGDPDEFEGF